MISIIWLIKSASARIREKREMTELANSLPPDFGETLTQIGKLGIAYEEAPQIRDRLISAIRAAGEQTQASGLATGDLGLGEWSAETLQRCERAIHHQICDPISGGLKEEYKDLLNKSLSDTSVNQIALIVTGALSPIFPTLIVSSVIVYFTLWLMKVGLTHWCRQATASARE